MTTPLLPGYTFEIDSVSPSEWYRIVSEFDDASVYQVWQDGSDDDRPSSICRVLLRREGQVVSVAEVRLVTVPMTDHGIAYVFWGPLTNRVGSDRDTFRQMLRAMCQEFVHRRGMILRVHPRLYESVHADTLGILSDEGFEPVVDVRPKRTLIMNLAPPVEEIRRSVDKRWRNCLAKAERSGLAVTSGTSLDLFDRFGTVYAKMLARKRLSPTADLAKHRRAQSRLPDGCKMRVVLIHSGGETCAGAIYSDLGDTAVYLFGASDGVGLSTSASYLLQWTILGELKERGKHAYDLNGIDPEGNPGVYHFKQGLAGKLGSEVLSVGQYQVARPSLANSSLLFIDRLRRRLRSGRTNGVRPLVHAR